LPEFFNGKQAGGLVQDPIVDLMYKTDISDPADRLGCLA